ncbi:MAG: roadblock/LC7 domain-containing protein, partial [Acidocella sp.]|nr:roadblock/LC7 domain-containing protein [Acidocella sp.]
MFAIKNVTAPTTEMIAVLQDLIGSSNAIEAAAVVARDGSVIADATRRGGETSALYAAIAELLAPGSVAMRQLGLGTLGQAVMSAASRRVMVGQSGQNALICTLTGGHGRGGSQVPSISAATAQLAKLLPKAEAPVAPPAALPPEAVVASPLPECPLNAEERARIAAFRPYVIGVLPSVTDKVYNAIEAEPQ